MTTATSPAPKDHPLVTFAVFAYNQEKYIREAVEGAFSQTYQPLEIILSDDCSTDGTFEIMQEMTAAYRGPHRIVTCRQKSNLGVVRHVMSVSRHASGELMVVNAGDDVSYAARSAALAREWLETGAVALYSNYDLISDTGALIAENLSFPEHPDTRTLFYGSRKAIKHNGRLRSIPGFAAAYRTSFWASLPLLDRRLLVEDGLATILLNIAGEYIAYVNSPLIAYRKTPNSLSMRLAGSSTADIIARENKICLSGKELIGRVDYILENGCVRDIEKRVFINLLRHRRHGHIIHKFWMLHPLQRVVLLSQARSWDDVHFILPRLLGSKTFVFMKQLQTLIFTIGTHSGG